MTTSNKLNEKHLKHMNITYHWCRRFRDDVWVFFRGKSEDACEVMEKLYLWSWILDWPSSSASSQDQYRLHDYSLFHWGLWQGLRNSFGVQSSTPECQMVKNTNTNILFWEHIREILNVFTYFVNRNLFIVYWICLTCSQLLCSVWTTNNCTVSVRGIM